ncbi:MAG TPA: hypothetical protein VGT07_10585, partial [Steroidobacteraceae bacterium]|nr:hypothetical protein [Steroidobacteraceae bacterium]
MACPQRVKQVEKAIAEHLKTVGAEDWQEVKQHFPDVGTSSFWRYVKRIKAQLEREAAPSVTPDLFPAEEKKHELLEPWQKPNPHSEYRALKHAQRYFELEM